MTAGEARQGEGERKTTQIRNIVLLKLAQHLRDDGRPFLGEADLVHGPLESSVVATSALVSKQARPNKLQQSHSFAHSQL